jgi:CheY-specific phosphatase CheX
MTSAANRPDLCRIGEDAFTQVLNTLLPKSSMAGNPSSCLSCPDEVAQITGSVLLTGPGLCARVLLEVPKGFVTLAARILTGLDGPAAEASGLLEDTAGELANMVAGGVATRLSEDGYACTLGIPMVSRHPLPSPELPPGVVRGGAALTWAGYRLAVQIQCQYAAP